MPAKSGQIKEILAKSMPSALITGFGPFPGVPRNPSGALMQRLAGNRRWARLGWAVEGILFPTSYSVVSQKICDTARSGARPAFVVMLGVAASAKWIRVELRAKNRVSIHHRDASGRRPASFLLEPPREVTRFGRHAGTPLVATLRESGVPARLSRDTGRYICNAAYWHMLGAMSRSTEVVFVHIPMPSRHGQRKRDPRPALGAMERALAGLIVTMIRRARIRC